MVTMLISWCDGRRKSGTGDGIKVIAASRPPRHENRFCEPVAVSAANPFSQPTGTVDRRRTATVALPKELGEGVLREMERSTVPFLHKRGKSVDAFRKQ